MRYLFILVFSFLSLALLCQTEIELRTDGIVVPRLETGSVTSPSIGQVIYDTLTAQLMYYDGNNWLSISGAFERNGTTVRQKEGIDTDDFMFGSNSLPPSTPISDTLIFFDQSKGAFRGGTINIGKPSWSEDSLGVQSFAYGQSVIASGAYGAIAMGDDTHAKGDYGATALGSGSVASGEDGATALGNSSLASGDVGATALGVNTEASGDYGATALGYFSEASGVDGATALGYFSEALGDYGATAIGYRTTATGDKGATALGNNTISNGDNCVVVGRYNDTLVTAGQDVIDTSPLFIIGNGDADFGNESNALVVLKNGEVSFEHYTFPIVDGTIGQILETDGSGQLSWVSPTTGNGAFEKAGSLVRQVSDVDADDFIFGRAALPPAGAITDKFMMYDQLTSSFRGGNVVSSANWNVRGVSSFGYGENVAPTGDRSAAFGKSTMAVGENSFSAGEGTQSTAFNGVAIGRYNTGTGSSTTWDASDPLFEIGIGTSDISRVNAFTVNKRGDVHINHSNNGGAGGLKLTNTASATESWRIYTASSTGNLRFYSDDNGSSATAWINDATGVYSSISDGRMKHQVQLIGTVLPSILGLKAKSYRYNAQNETDKKSIGFIAQEIEKLFPELVSYDKDEDLYGINYAGFSVIAIKAIQEQQDVINKVVHENDYLKKEIEEIKNILKDLQASHQ